MVHLIRVLLQSPVRDDLIPFMNWKDKQDGSTDYLPCTIHDHGCGEGDGTMFLRSMFPFAEVKGLDFWPGAIDICKERWTENDVSWEVCDIRDPPQCDLMFAVQTLDHLPLEELEEIVDTCIGQSRIFVGAWADLGRHAEHLSQAEKIMMAVPEFKFKTIKPRIVPATGAVIRDPVHTYVWYNHDLRRQHKLAKDRTRFAV